MLASEIMKELWRMFQIQGLTQVSFWKRVAPHIQATEMSARKFGRPFNGINQISNNKGSTYKGKKQCHITETLEVFQALF